MENRIAIIENGKVKNIILASDDFASSLGVEYVNVTDTDVKKGDLYSGGVFESVAIKEQLPGDPEVLTKEEEERAWRDSELTETDHIPSIADYPNFDNYIIYRQALRDYPDTEDFPNGDRPVLTEE